MVHNRWGVYPKQYSGRADIRPLLNSTSCTRSGQAWMNRPIIGSLNNRFSAKWATVAIGVGKRTKSDEKGGASNCQNSRKRITPATR